MVVGLEDWVGKLTDKSKYFSLPFNSVMVMVIGSKSLKAFVALLSERVAKNVLSPSISLILLVMEPWFWSVLSWVPEGYGMDVSFSQNEPVKKGIRNRRMENVHFIEAWST